MAATGLIGMVDATFTYFQSLASWHKDPASLEAVREIKDRMIRDLEALDAKTTKPQRAELCKTWRTWRIEATGKPTYAPDMFIESVCQAIEIS